MHELNILMEVVDMTEKIAKENDIPEIASIVLQIGELSTVVPMFMEEYYPMMIENRKVLENSKLEIETIEGIGECCDCGERFNVVACDGFCPVCGSYNKKIVSGREFIVKEIRVPVSWR